jgi:hypothetical protein
VKFGPDLIRTLEPGTRLEGRVKATKTGLMKLRHAAALALVSWYLMVPPRSEGGADVRAPLGDWIICTSYDTADACEEGLRQYSERLADDLQAHSDNRAFVAWAKQATPHARCIATDDPRLKSK